MKQLFPVLALALVTLSGCLAGDDDTDAPDGWTPAAGYSDPGFQGAIPVAGDGHDHADPQAHKLAHNATLLSNLDLREFGSSQETPVGAHALAVHEDMIAVAVNNPVGGTEGQQGFHLIDASDPADLVHIAYWDAGVPVGGDRTIAWSDDGQYVFLGFEGGPRPGLAAVDVSDPTSPEEVAFWTDEAEFGPHTVATGDIDGTTYVFALVAGVNILAFDGSGFTLVGKFVTQDELGAADALGHIDPTDPQDTYWQTYLLRSVYAHDTNFYIDPETGTPLLLVAYAYDGMKILDISNPSAPVLQGRFRPPADTDHEHYTHSVTAERLDDGRLIVVVGSETFEDENQHIASPIWILDATDALDGVPLQNAPAHLSTWRNPSDAPAGALGLSVHFFRQQDGNLYLSHYHGGVWALSLKTEAERTDPQASAFLMPIPDDAVRPPDGCCLGFDLEGAPMVFDVDVMADGTVVAADLVQGVSTIEVVGLD